MAKEDASGTLEADVHADTVGDLVREQAKEHGHRTAVLHRDASATYEELEARSNRIAGALGGLGVGPGDRVAVSMTNRLEYLDTWFGIAKTGAVVVPLNVALKGEMLTYNLEDSGATTLILEDRLAPPFRRVRDDLTALDEVVVLGDADGLDDARSFGELLDADPEPHAIPVDGPDPASIIYTSGTTGPPKGVVLPHHSYVNTGRWFVRIGELTRDDVPFTTLPLFHVNAQQTTTMGSMIAGVPFALERKFSASRFWDQIRDYGATIFNYIGSIIPILHKQEPRPDDADNPARLGIGAACPPDMWEAFEERFDVKIVEGYGLTETGTVATINPPDATKVGTIGPAIDYMDVEVVDPETDAVLPPGEEGEIVIRPNEPYAMMLEYHDKPEATVEAWRNLWFHTGDLGVKDEDGYLRFIDRMKDAIRVRGENVSSFFVQKVVGAHPAVMECAAFGVPSDFEDGEDEVKVDVVLREDADLDPAELIAFAAERLPHFAVPRYVQVRDALPKTATERVRKFELKETGTSDAWDREAAGVQVPRG